MQPPLLGLSRSNQIHLAIIAQRRRQQPLRDSTHDALRRKNIASERSIAQAQAVISLRPLDRGDLCSVRNHVIERRRLIQECARELPKVASNVLFAAVDNRTATNDAQGDI